MEKRDWQGGLWLLEELPSVRVVYLLGSEACTRWSVEKDDIARRYSTVATVVLSCGRR